MRNDYYDNVYLTAPPCEWGITGNFEYEQDKDTIFEFIMDDGDLFSAHLKYDSKKTNLVDFLSQDFIDTLTLYAEKCCEKDEDY